MSSVDWTAVTKDQVRVGDLVSTDAGGMPLYKVVAVDGGMARLEDEQHRLLESLPLDRFHWKAASRG